MSDWLAWLCSANRRRENEVSDGPAAPRLVEQGNDSGASGAAVVETRMLVLGKVR